MATLFDGDSSDEEGKLNINKDYAEKYDQWRQKEEFQKLKDKYGETAALHKIDDDSSSSSSETEDENGDGWTSDIEKDFLNTLASLKTKDPSIYDSSRRFFTKKEILPQKKEKKEKALFIRDYERKMILEKGGNVSDEEESPSKFKTYNEEQEDLKKGFQQFLKDSDSEDENLLKVRRKTANEKEKEENDYKEWLKNEREDINDEEIKKKLKPLKDYWSNPMLDENEKFLKSYILDKKYLDPEDTDYIPSYEEIVHDSEGDLSEDDKTLEAQAEFEHKFNFRFEEPDPEFIKRYPRTIADSLRKKDETRKKKREEIKERKKMEKDKKKEELQQLKKYKLKEIQEKLEQLKTITGNTSLPFQDDDFEEDFDPLKHDAKMKEIFDDDYYNINDGDQKPQFPYDENIDDENWDQYGGEKESEQNCTVSEDTEPHCEDPDFNMDCEYEERKSNQEELISMSRRGKGRKKSLFAQKVENKKPVFDPKQFSKYEDYLEEYYKLDYEDIIGDLPVRFKYRKVIPNDFGLDTEEILSAADRELNRWCSVKKTCQYKGEDEELRELHVFKSKKNNVQLKKKIMPSLFAEDAKEEGAVNQSGQTKNKKENPEKQDIVHQNGQIRKRKESTEEQDNVPETKKQKTESETVDHTVQSINKSKKKKKKKKPLGANNVVRDETNKTIVQKISNSEVKAPAMSSTQKRKTKTNSSSEHTMGISDERLKAYGLNPKKFKNQQKFGKGSKS